MKHVTMLELFKEVKNKKFSGMGDIEVLNREGFWLFNAQEGGAYHEDDKNYKRIDLFQPDWIAKLPTVEVLTAAEIEKRFAVKPEHHDQSEQGFFGTYVGCTSRNRPIVLLAATRKGELEFRGTHGYVRLLTPKAGDKYLYELKTMGQFAYPFPQGFWDTSVLFLVFISRGCISLMKMSSMPTGSMPLGL